jgi:hypothetical protein
MHLHKAFRAECVTSPLIAAFGRGTLSVLGISTRRVVSQNPHLTSGHYGEPVFGASGYRTVSNLSQMSSSSSDTSGCR